MKTHSSPNMPPKAKAGAKFGLKRSKSDALRKERAAKARQKKKSKANNTKKSKSYLSGISNAELRHYGLGPSKWYGR